jgi:pSer/pThr/pTyr-binding forkhead associated (FHA) protein
VICSACGATLGDEARFCSQCGTPTDVEDTQVTGALSPVDALSDSGPQSPVPGSAQFAVLLVHRGPNEGSAFTLTPPLVKIGRGPDQEVFLDDITVSRKHAELRAGPSGWQLVDLGSLNGTYVNRAPVQEALLVSGDEIQIGKYRFRFMCGGGGGE